MKVSLSLSKAVLIYRVRQAHPDILLNKEFQIFGTIIVCNIH